MDEFALIRQHFSRLTPGAADVTLGIGDDCALLRPPAGEELAVTTDTLVAGRHFPLDTAAGDIGWKSLAVSLSDLAAMGAQPRWFLLALTLPHPDELWLQAFVSGLKALTDLSGISLVGGDTTRGPLSITITAFGSVPSALALRRDRAQPGDRVCVTGTLGDAALALARGGFIAANRFDDRAPCAPTQHDDLYLRARLDRPAPRFAAGLALRGIATAAIDLSDGLAGDLLHLLDASSTGAVIDTQTLPMSDPFSRLAMDQDRLAMQAAGGDDYELCVCIPPSRIDEARAALDVPLTVIGRVTTEPGLVWLDASGRPVESDLRGYQHFS